MFKLNYLEVRKNKNKLRAKKEERLASIELEKAENQINHTTYGIDKHINKMNEMIKASKRTNNFDSYKQLHYSAKLLTTLGATVSHKSNILETAKGVIYAANVTLKTIEQYKEILKSIKIITKSLKSRGFNTKKILDLQLDLESELGNIIESIQNNSNIELLASSQTDNYGPEDDALREQFDKDRKELLEREKNGY